MADTEFHPVVRRGLVGGAGRIIAICTGIMLLYIPYFYWGVATQSGSFNAARLSLFNYGIIFVQLTLAMAFFLPSMNEKYLRSGHGPTRIVGVRLLLLAVFALLVIELSLVATRGFAPPPAFITSIGERGLILLLSGWVYFYLTLMVIPGSYPRFLYLSHMAKKLKFPMPVTIKYQRRKTVLYMPDSANNHKIEVLELSWKDGQPGFSPLKTTQMPWWKFMLGLPFVALILAVLIGSLRGNFLANDALEARYTELYPFALLGALAAALLASFVNERRFAARVATVAAFMAAMAAFGLQSAALKGFPLIAGMVHIGQQPDERTFRTLPQPPRLQRTIASTCASPRWLPIWPSRISRYTCAG